MVWVSVWTVRCTVSVIFCSVASVELVPPPVLVLVGCVGGVRGLEGGTSAGGVVVVVVPSGLVVVTGATGGGGGGALSAMFFTVAATPWSNELTVASVVATLPS